ncbi:MAG: hypothetical protein ACREQE_12490, partial [Candidatus Binataceae bacterium]
DKTAQFGKVQTDIQHSTGTAAQLATMRGQAADFQFAKLTNNIELLRDALGETLLPVINEVIPKLTAGLRAVTGWASAHKGIVRVALEIAALGAAILIPLGSLALLFASFAFIGSYVPLVGALAGVFGTLAGATWGAVSAGIAFMATNPIGWVIAAVAGIAALAYVIYKYRDAIAAWFSKVKTWFTSINWRSLGMSVLKEIGRGILAGIPYMLGPLGVAAKLIYDHFKGHSPPPLGPLHDIDRVNLMGEVAKTIRPAPILTAVRNVAALTALALPMVVAPAMAMPAMVAGAAPARGSSAPIAITVNYTVNHVADAAAGDGFERAAEMHAHRLVEIINRELAKRARTEF